VTPIGVLFGGDPMKHLAACIKAAPPLPRQCGGVYVLAPLCRPCAVLYVGMTAAGFDRRWQEHADDLRLGRHVNDALRALWRQYGDLHAAVLWVGPKAQARAMEVWYMGELRRRGWRLANEVG
jgi:hypothetical protein